MTRNLEQRVRGKIYESKDKIHMKAEPSMGPIGGFVGGGDLIDLEVGEIFGDFIGKDVEVSISEKKIGKPRYTEKEWSFTEEKDVDPDYNHASAEAYESFQDRKCNGLSGLM